MLLAGIQWISTWNPLNSKLETARAKLKQSNLGSRQNHSIRRSLIPRAEMKANSKDSPERTRPSGAEQPEPGSLTIDTSTREAVRGRRLPALPIPGGREEPCRLRHRRLSDTTCR